MAIQNTNTATNAAGFNARPTAAYAPAPQAETRGVNDGWRPTEAGGELAPSALRAFAQVNAAQPQEANVHVASEVLNPQTGPSVPNGWDNEELASIVAEIHQHRQSRQADREALTASVQEGWNSAMEEVKAKSDQMQGDINDMWRGYLSNQGMVGMGMGMGYGGYGGYGGYTPGYSPGYTPGMYPNSPGMMYPNSVSGGYATSYANGYYPQPGMLMQPGMLGPGYPGTYPTPGLNNYNGYNIRPL